MQVRQLQEQVSTLELQLQHRGAFPGAAAGGDPQAAQQQSHRADVSTHEWPSNSLITSTLASTAAYDGGASAAAFAHQLRQLDEVADTWKQVRRALVEARSQ